MVLATQALVSGGIDIGTLTTYIPLFLSDFLKMNIYERGVVYTVGLLGGVVGPVLSGIYADRAGYIRVSMLAVGFASILTYLLIPYKLRGEGIMLALHLFALMFVSFSLPTLLQSHLVRVTSDYSRDLAVRIFFTTGFIFNSLWSGIVGHIIDVYASFKPAFIMMRTLG